MAMAEAPGPIPPYHLRAAVPADRPEIIPLLVQLAPSRDQAAHRAWLYDGNPAGPALTWVAVDDASGEIAGVTSYFPWRLWAGGREVRAAIGGDGVVHPKFRRRGIAAALHAALRAEMPKHGMEVMFGAPAAMNRSPLKAAGSRHITEMARYVRPLAASAFHRDLALLDPIVRPLLTPQAQGVRLEPMRPDDPRVDKVWAATRGELGVATVRDSRYYTWRFLRSPSQAQKAFVAMRGDSPVGIGALERRGLRLAIIDLCAPQAHWGGVLGAIGSHDRDAHSVELRLIREDGEARRVQRHGYFRRDGADFLVVTPEGTADGSIYHDPARWTYQEGDVDIDRTG